MRADCGQHERSEAVQVRHAGVLHQEAEEMQRTFADILRS